MNKTMILIPALILTGCSLKSDYQIALNNYAKDNCDGKLLQVATLSLNGTISSEMWFRCVTDKGVETHKITIKDIPVKYWGLPGESNK